MLTLCPEILHIAFSELMQGLGCAVGMQGLWCSSSPLRPAFPPCSCLTAHGALTPTASRSGKRKGNTSFSSWFLALLFCWFSTHNLGKTRLTILFTRITPLPTASCVPGPAEWGGCCWDGVTLSSLPELILSQTLIAPALFLTLPGSSIWASLLKAASWVCRSTAFHSCTSVQGKSRQNSSLDYQQKEAFLWHNKLSIINFMKVVRF